MNKKLIEMSLLGSASALGLNWIYDPQLMKTFSDHNNVLFLPIQHQLYKKATHGFDVYPTHTVGDLDFMGEVLFQFHRFLHNGGTTPEDFRTHLYQSFGPESCYDGYIEKYGKTLLTRIDESNYVTTEIDKQLIGPAMFVIGYAHGLSKSTIQGYTSVLTVYQNIPYFQAALSYIFKHITNESKKIVLLESVHLLPREYTDASEKALGDMNIEDFIKTYSGIACGLEQSYPLVLYIVNNTASFKDALRLNASLGGASCARGILIGAIYAFLDDIPTDFIDILNVLV